MEIQPLQVSLTPNGFEWKDFATGLDVNPNSQTISNCAENSAARGKCFGPLLGKWA
jgi:hypothetical protein